MYYRCDGGFDCKDKSDEDVCDLLLIDEGRYNKDYPPLNGGKPVNVTVHFNIESIQNIKEIDMDFNVKFTISLEWTDGRLTFSNLNEGNFVNLDNEIRYYKKYLYNVLVSNMSLELRIVVIQ